MTTSASAYRQATTGGAEELSAQVWLFCFAGNVQAIRFQNHLNESFDRIFFLCVQVGVETYWFIILFFICTDRRNMSLSQWTNKI